jgi:hypothetical protein
MNSHQIQQKQANNGYPRRWIQQKIRVLSVEELGQAVVLLEV